MLVKNVPPATICFPPLGLLFMLKVLLISTRQLRSQCPGVTSASTRNTNSGIPLSGGVVEQKSIHSEKLRYGGYERCLCV